MAEHELKTVHGLDFHEFVAFKDENANVTAYILRVPGGWIYNFCGVCGSSSVFIPYSSEFKSIATEYEVHTMEKS
ncbi:MAG: hypothetical protein MUP81_01765 [Dehalococcoidia bacterium]|nr:hypothetical protein [Dehalococcoidia bacterium]